MSLKYFCVSASPEEFNSSLTASFHHVRIPEPFPRHPNRTGTISRSYATSKWQTPPRLTPPPLPYHRKRKTTMTRASTPRQRRFVTRSGLGATRVGHRLRLSFFLCVLRCGFSFQLVQYCVVRQGKAENTLECMSAMNARVVLRSASGDNHEVKSWVRVGLSRVVGLG